MDDSGGRFLPQKGTFSAKRLRSYFAGSSLVLYELFGFAYLIRVPQIVSVKRLKVLIKFVYQRYTRGYLQGGYLIIGYPVKMFDQRSQAVTVGRDEDGVARKYLRCYHFLPVGEEPFYRILKAFRKWDVFFTQVFVSGVVSGIPLIIFFKSRRGSEIVSPP